MRTVVHPTLRPVKRPAPVFTRGLAGGVHRWCTAAYSRAFAYSHLAGPKAVPLAWQKLCKPSLTSISIDIPVGTA
jgi:hypothetical protein